MGPLASSRCRRALNRLPPGCRPPRWSAELHLPDRIAGSRFDIDFPQLEVDASPAAPEAKPLPLAQGRGEHVLYVDDDDVMLTMVDHLLLQLGYRATSLADPRAALAAVRAGVDPFDIVVTDLNMPQMSGLELALALRGVAPGLPVVISSGFIPEKLRNEALAAGVVALMRKERTLDGMPVVVANALAACAARRGSSQT